MKTVEIEVGGHVFILLAEKAVLEPHSRTLFVADLHLGKTATFRNEGIPLPEGSTETDLARISKLVERWDVRLLVVLGDLFHAAQGVPGHVTETFVRWRQTHAAIPVTLVLGNHDRRLRAWPPEWALEMHPEPHPWNGLHLRHFPPRGTYVEGPVWLAGHVHPSVRVRLGGRESITAPAFHVRSRGIVLPAFGSFTGTATQRPQADDQAYAVVGESVLPIPAALRRR
ncbi:MAG: ligase-associated DNA damage response endonuclease PdeM [Opitutales bacterium]